jgi:hypothetical protein
MVLNESTPNIRRLVSARHLAVVLRSAGLLTHPLRALQLPQSEYGGCSSWSIGAIRRVVKSLTATSFLFLYRWLVLPMNSQRRYVKISNLELQHSPSPFFNRL